MESIAITLDPLYWQIGVPALACGLVVGALSTWLTGRARRRRLEETVILLETRIRDQDSLRRERESTFEAATTRLASTFSNLANQSLQANSEHFLRLAEQNLGLHQERARRDLGERGQAIENLVKPIEQSLAQAQRQIAELEKARSEAYGGIREQLESMQQGQSALTRETRNLVNALRRPEVRGRWGEITLRRLVELAGMARHCDFREQVHTRDDEQNLRPDMIVRLPDERELVVDVKAPLDAYLEAIEAPDETGRKAALERHARNVRQHVGRLAGKAYWAQFERSPEFVILFIPGDQFLSAALGEQPGLIDEALERQVILATPTSLVALLKAVAYGWRQVALADNAGEIRRLAEELYRRLGAFTGHLERMGRQLGASVEHYNRAVGSLERKVLPGARRFVELGIRPKQPLGSLQTLDAAPRRTADQALGAGGDAALAATDDDEALT